MQKKKSRRTCEICGVKEAHLGEPLFFANFPLNENRCKEWVRLTGNQDFVHVPIEKLNSIKHVCGNHFNKRDLNKHGNKLKKRAIPCLNLKFPPLSSEQMSGFPCHLCENSDILHVFPNPTNDPDRFKSWLCAIGGEISALNAESIFKIRRVCHKHFEVKYHTRSRRLSNNAIPSLHLTSQTEPIPKRTSDVDSSNVPSTSRRESERLEPGSTLSQQSVKAIPIPKPTLTLDSDGDGTKTNKPTISQGETERHKLYSTLLKKPVFQGDPRPYSKKTVAERSLLILNQAARDRRESQVFEDDGIVHEVDDTNFSDEKECIFSWQKSNAVVPCEDIEFFPPKEEKPTPAPQKKETEPALEYRHENVVCNICSNDIIGFRYVCVQCADVDLCAACEARRAHRRHYVLRVPPRRPQSEVFEKLHTIRRALLSDAIVELQPSTLDDSVSIKEEEPDPMNIEPVLETPTGPMEYETTTIVHPATSSVVTSKDCDATSVESDATFNVDSEESDDSESDSTVPAPRIITTSSVLIQSNTQTIQPKTQTVPYKYNPSRSLLRKEPSVQTAVVQKVPLVSPVSSLRLELQKAPIASPSGKQPMRIIDLSSLPEHVRKKFKIQHIRKIQKPKPKIQLKDACVKIQRLNSTDMKAALHRS